MWGRLPGALNPVWYMRAEPCRCNGSRDDREITDCDRPCYIPLRLTLYNGELQASMGKRLQGFSRYDMCPSDFTSVMFNKRWKGLRGVLVSQTWLQFASCTFWRQKDIWLSSVCQLAWKTQLLSATEKQREIQLFLSRSLFFDITRLYRQHQQDPFTDIFTKEHEWNFYSFN